MKKQVPLGQFRAAVSTKVNVKSPMKWLMLLAIMLIPALSMAQTALSGWTLSSNSNTSRSISCGTTYTLKVSTSGSTTRDQYCTITSSTSGCPITVTLTANSLKPTGVTATNYAYVYNGSGTGGTQLAQWTSSTSTGTSVTSTGGTVTIRFDRNSTIASNVTFTVSIYQPCCGTPPSTTYSCPNDIHQIGAGTSTSNTYGPVNNYYKYNYRQIIYNASEFDNRPGTVKAIAFQYAYTTAMTKKLDTKVYMANTSTGEFASNTSWITTGLQQVYSGQMNFQSQGWAWIILDTPFEYTGENLLVVIDDNSGDYDGSSYTFYYSGSTSDSYRQLYQQSDSYNYGNTDISAQSGTLGNYRPNTKFCVEHNCDVRTDNFAFANQSVSLVAGETYTQNVTGGSNVTYSMTCNPAGIATFNSTTHTVTTVAGRVGTVTVTATWPASDGYCEKTASYTIDVDDGCAKMSGGTVSSSGTYGGIYTYFNYYAYTQQIYRASEIIAAGGCQGTINSIAFRYGETTSSDLSFELYIGATGATTVPTSWITDANLVRVYSGTRTFTSDNNGWNTINFTTPFEWDGVSNIVIAVRRTSTTQGSVTYPNFYHTSSDGMAAYLSNSSSAITINGSNVATSTGSTTNQRPLLKFCIDCCDDNITGDFHFQYENINYVAGSGAPMANPLVNGTGISTGIVYSSSNTSYVTVSSAGVVTIANNVPEGDYTVTAKIPNNNGCNKNASYTIHVTDGCTQVGNATYTTYTAPIYTSSSGYYSYTQQIYTASEIIAAGGCQGTINDIKFQYSTTATENYTQSIRVYMGTTGQGSLSNGWIGDAGLQQVYNGSVTFSPGWNTIHLSTPFDWNGVDNIVVAVMSNGTSGTTYRYFHYNSTTGGARYYYSSSSFSLNGSNIPTEDGYSTSSRPNIRFCIDCCDDIVSETFAFDNPTEVEYVIGSGAFTPPHLTNNTGMTGISYSCSSDSENGSSVGSVNATTGAVSFTGNEGYLTVTAKLAVAGGCAKYTHYRVFVNDGCKRVGTGTTTSTSSLINNYKYIWDEMIYKGSEIDGGGTINRISVRAVSNGTISRTVKIYLGLTDKNTFSSSTDFIPLSELTQVYSGTLTFTAGWNDFPLSRTFSVPCGKNLVVAFDIDASSYASESFYATSLPSSCIRAYSDSDNSPLADMSTYDGSTTLFADRPNIKLCITECNCPDLSFDQTSVTFCTNATPVHPSLTCNSTGARTWTSSDPSVVRITNATTGAMTVVGVGNCIITLNVAATGQHCAAAASYNVRVMANCPTLHYDLSSCTGTSTPASIPDYVGYGLMTLSDVVPQCSTPGMAFAGWCVDPTGDGSYYHPGSTFPLYRDTVLYAIFYTRCCHPDSASVSYTHQTVTIDGDSYAVHPNQSIDVSRASDGYFYYDLCLGEGDGKIHATVNLPDGCTYSNQTWMLNYADGTSLVTNATGNSFEHVIDSVIGYGLTFRARSSEGCWLQLNGRIRVSPGINVTSATLESFSVCPESYVPISIGLSDEEGVQVTVNRPGTNVQSTLGHAERIFLPDGVPCDLDGDGSSDCGYVSAVNFTDFQNGSVVRSVEDILYLSMSIEHSFIGDLFIKVTCPNGQEATILKKYESGTSDCLASILALSDNESDVRGWQVTGSSSADFGVPNTSYASSSSGYACDSSYSDNAIGTPWRYAWSNNSTRNYEYAGGTYGLVYESENVTGTSVDSTDLANMTNLYHPDQSFESLVGCPLNGEWKITVIDGYSVDNGWLVDWQLALSEDLAGEVWNYQVNLDTAFMSCTLTNNSKSITIHTPDIPAAGDYNCNLVLVDEFGCLNDNELNYHFNIKEIVVSLSVEDADCGEDNGKITASVTNGGCGPDAQYTYTLTSSTNETTVNNSGVFPHLYGGDYHLLVECEDGCQKEMDINVPTTGSVGIVLDGTVGETCAGNNDGQITVHVTGSGSGNYTYNTNTGGYSCTDGHFTNVAPGTYTVTVTDNGTGCTGTVNNVVVPAATPMSLTIETPTSDQCPLASGSNYSISATPGGGNGSYQNYAWSVVIDGSAGTISGTGNNATIASDGRCHQYVVSLSLTDGNGCSAVASATFSTVDNTKPTINTTATNNQDLGCDPASITPPTFTVTDNCATGLTPTVTTTGVQGTGCAKTQTWTANVTDNCNNAATPVSITYTWTESQAPTFDAIADQNAQMATSGCKYKMIDLQAVAMAAAHDACGGTVTFVSQSVAAGTEYTQTNAVQTIPVTVTVRGTCDKTATSTVNVIIPAKDITVSIDQAGASVCAGGDTTLTVTGSSSNGTPTYTWAPTTGLTPTTGNSVTATVSTETTYTVTATDPAGCTATDQITVTINPEVILSVSPTSQEKCLGVAINPVTITVTNGTIDNESTLQTAVEALGLTYNNGSISGTPNAPGVHTFDFTAVSNQTPQCSAVDGSFTIDVTNLITPVIAGDEDICVTTSEANTLLSLNETAGDNSFTYNWNVGADGTILSGQGTNAITAQWSSVGDKTVTVTLTLDDCSAQATKTIHVRPVPTATIAEVSGDICPNAGTIDISGSNTATTPNYTYTWGGTLALNHNTNTVATPTDVVTATIPNDDCNATYNVTLNVTDNYGCKNTAAPITVTVRDIEAPQVAGSMPDKDVEGCNVSVLTTAYPAANTVAALESAASDLGGSLTVSDNCTTDKSQLTLQLVSQTNTGSCPIEVTRKYVVKDLCGKVSDTISQIIRINMPDDITVPSVSQASTVDCESMAVASSITLPTVTDACGEEILPVGAPIVQNDVANCNGDKSFTYTYRDCANHERTWDYTFTVAHPAIIVPGDSISQIGCLEDTSNTFLPVQITDACGNAVSAVLLGTADMSGYDMLTDMGQVVFHYQYTDCAGQTYPWNLTYDIAPTSFTPTTNGESTVSCIALATPQSPEPRTVCGTPIDYHANPANPIDSPSDILAAGGCGTRVYEYTYDVHGQPYTWTYTYIIRPDSIVFEGDVVTRDTVECDDPSFTPTLPTVTTNCGLTVDTALTMGGTYAGCEGTRIWNYTFTDCAGHSRTWSFTRVIKRTTVPQLTYTPSANTNDVECLVAAVAPTDLPTVVDVCGNVLSDPQPAPVVTDDLSANGCYGTRTYSYTYTDCAGLETVWTYTYNIQHTTAPSEKPNGLDGYATVSAASTVECIATAVAPTTLPVVLDVCGTVLEPLPGSGEYFDTVTDCEGTRTYKYFYKDCQQLTYEWHYVYTIDRTTSPFEVGGPVATHIDNVACIDTADVAHIAAMPVVQDVCGATLQPVEANPVADESGYSNCHGAVVYNFVYRDCAGLEMPWSYTFNIDMPVSEPLTAGAATVLCEADALEDDIQFPNHQFACGGSHTISAADRTAAPTSVIADGAGTVTFHYEYSDCEGNPYTWDFVYTVEPAPLTLPADVYDTVFCISSVQLPTPAPLRECGVNLFEGVTPEYESAMNNGCGDTTFVFRYHANGVDTAWRYHYHVEPVDFTLPADGEITLECYNEQVPDAALVPVVAAGNGICYEIQASAPVRNADGTDSYDGCQGDVTWTYTYTNCAYSHTWKYTYHVLRTTLPLVSTVPASSSVTCADLADGSFTMPTVTDACGAEIAAPVPVITPENPSNCNSTKVYTYTYFDPCNDALSSQFVYTYNINDNVAPTIGTIAAADIPAAIPTGTGCQYTIPSLEAVTMSVAGDGCSEAQWVGQSPAAGELYTAQATATTVPVVVTVKDGCDNTKTSIVNITIPANSLQLPTIAGVSICYGQEATLMASPTSTAMPINCVWTSGSSVVAQGEAPLSIAVSPTVNTTYNVTATDAAGCTSERSVVVSVSQPTSTSFTQVVCEGYDWYNHGTTSHYSESGTYINEYTSAQGCPSTDTLHLTVYHNTSAEFTETACDSYTWNNHNWSQTYTVGGNYQHNYNTPEGCPSTDILHLTLNYNTSTTYDQIACDSYTWNNHGWSQQYTTSGTFSHDYTTEQGCPSTDVLNLTVNYSGTGDVWITECEQYTWFGNNYTTSGDYSHNLRTVHNCDSTVTLHLTIIGVYTTDLYDTVCFGESYTWYDDTYTQPGNYTHMLTSSLGCDSLLTMHLSHLPVVRVGIDETHSCKTGQYTLTVSSINSNRYAWWSDPDNDELAQQSNETEVTVLPLVATTYYVKAWTAGHDECAVTANIKLNPVRMPRASFETHPSYLSMERTDWNATDHSSDVDWRNWYVNGSYYSDGTHVNGTITPPVDSLNIVLIVGTEECQDTARRVIPYANVNLWIPNAFTPSQDWNNLFGAEGTGIKDFEMWVFNREGLLVFHSETMGDKWDGTHNGTKCPQSTYTYRVSYTTVAEPESEILKVGTVTLLR